MILIAALAAYADSFSGAFVFDDTAGIEHNERITSLWPPTGILTRSTRPVVDLTLAVNYAVGHFEVTGYHVVNLAIHIAAGLVLMGVVRRTLQLPVFAGGYDRSADLFALIIALIWTVHPLQTQSVTYVIQRAESLMGLFYLLTFYCIVRGASVKRAGRWFVCAVIACALGMASKAVMVTAPIAAVIFDRTFLSSSFRQMIRERWHLHGGLAATWLVLVATGIFAGVFGLKEGKATVGYAYEGISPVAYALTQPGVILYYLRLALWPWPLCLDYGWPVVHAVSETLPSLICLALLVGATIWLLKRRSAIAFPAAWFFLILAPTSSFVPIKDVIFEHRMYLPLAGIVTLVVMILHAAASKMGAALSIGPRTAFRVRAVVVVAVVGMLGVMTFRQNRVYKSDVSLWAHVVEHRPLNARGHLGLGTALSDIGRNKEAEPSLRETIRLAPDCVDAHYTYGNVLRALGRTDEAIEQYHETIALDPTYVKAFINLGNTFVDRGQWDEAQAQFRAVVNMDRALVPPIYLARANFNLANGLARRGQVPDAIQLYKNAIAAYPGYYNAHYGLGLAYVRTGRVADAISEFETTLELNPGHRDARQALDSALSQRGD